jgi:hypothetical protein
MEELSREKAPEDFYRIMKKMTEAGASNRK